VGSFSGITPITSPKSSSNRSLLSSWYSWYNQTSFCEGITPRTVPTVVSKQQINFPCTIALYFKIILNYKEYHRSSLLLIPELGIQHATVLKISIHLDRRSLDVETLGFKLHKSGCCTLQRGNIYSSWFFRGIDFATVSSIFIFIIFYVSFSHARHSHKCWFLNQMKGKEFIDEIQADWKRVR
jgi:hypothetical protein